MNPLENLPPFYVGQKVVCVDTSFDPECKYNHLPNDIVKGNTYVVKLCEFYDNEWWTGVNGSFWNYDVNTFRPLQESAFPTLTLSRVIEKELQLTSMN